MTDHKPMLGTRADWPEYLASLSGSLQGVDAASLRQWSDLLWDAYQRDAQVYLIGNGGSGNNAAHFCQDFSKSLTPESRSQEDGLRRLRTLNLTDLSGWMLAIGNDLGYDQLFEQQLRTLARSGDVLIALSGSGNSQNVLTAVEYAKRLGMTTIGLTGFDGGKLAPLVDLNVHVPCHDMGISESIHLCLFHWVLDDLYGRINRVGRYGDSE